MALVNTMVRPVDKNGAAVVLKRPKLLEVRPKPA